ncbi:glycosyltransferase [Montanilutibacter psychrotolerans]|uniref:Glycosyltransferase n=1 Tax=Montanilutibacter psychrotolerans TaxID=1327343 RepID=A0A3M8SXM7_9GAMM|nr:glycosyltransferase [Lysobacter psychrotolerans]RNF84206.1 glycosyltransferase [Lysobacter psychrotolerans]
MRLNAAELRFLFDRATGLLHRGVGSLRTRGLGPTWQRLCKQFERVPPAQRTMLYVPQARAFAPFALPTSDAPRASIVIPVFNQFAHTLGCLRALAEHPPEVAFEVIVVDDGSSDDTRACLEQVAGLRYHRRAANGGFIAACNDGAALARGDYLVLLNNDTAPQPGWLDTLLATFDEHPGTGLVGAQLLYPDGRLQEAGGVVWRDGSADKLGRLQSPDHPAFRHVRRVDYCSGAAIALPRSLFERVGGFDTRYAPAFYEDTDLAMQVRAQGLQVLVQPFSRVLHVEGVTTGTDTRHGVKAWQVRNQQTFAQRWQAELATHPEHGTAPVALADHRHRRVVLVIDALTPQPDRDSGSLRLVNLMRLLREEGAHVVFIAADRGHVAGHTEALQRMGVETWYAPYATALPAWLREHGSRFDSVIGCRHYVLRELLPLLRRHAPQARVVFDTVDLHYLRERRGAELSGDTTQMRVAERTRALELDVIARSDATLVVSAIERELLARETPQAHVDILSNLHQPAGPGLPFAQRHDVVFVGGFRHPPNVDAVRWFVDEAWPRVLQGEPALRFHCIGADAPAEILALGERPGVIVHGHVPDLAPYMEGVRLAVAPLRYGAGVKGKVNLSMAHGQPVIATRCAVEGMHLVDGEDVLVADDPQEFADALLHAYRNETLWQRLADRGRTNVERHFSLDAGREVVRRVVLGGADAAP